MSKECPYCGYKPKMVLDHCGEYDSRFGSICQNCLSEIPPDDELEMVKINKIKKEELKKKLINYLMEKKNGNKI